MSRPDRRQFLAASAASVAGAIAQTGARTILLRGSWQTVNIGDIAHTPGFLRIVEKHLPNVKVILWPQAIAEGVEPMLRARFPKLEIARTDAEVAAAFEKADLFVQGSAASPNAVPQMEQWRKASTKPYGFFGITVTAQSEAASAAINARSKAVLDGAEFLFTRETRSLENVKSAGVQARTMEFVPDATFSMDLRDDAKADRFLAENKLEKFVVVIPRLRYTPYHKFRKVDWTAEEIARRDAVNAEKEKLDGAKLRTMIEGAVAADCQVLLAAEMTYQLEMLGPLLYDPLPDRIKPRVVKRATFWLPDEAASVYARAQAVLSSECHSPILALVQGTPSHYLHQKEDGIKGQMWNDLGLGDWYFDIDEMDAKSIARNLPSLFSTSSRARGAAALRKAQDLHASGARRMARVL